MLSPTPSTRSSRLAFLKKTDFLQGIESQAFLECLAEEMEELTFAKNQIILHRGDREPLLYFMVEGKVKIHVDGIKMAELSQGAHFGNVNIFDSQPASASITTLQASRCLVLHQSKLQAVLQKHSDIKSELVARLYQRQQQVRATTWQKSVVRDWYTRLQNPSWAY
ncbi:cyclic nucleotide-binding domain-containing protein [Acaryochloris sp. IP29b_bin.148]|uniref:Crp/Fnr family transcriptional regulator n=1 Tax=Acaryochloris sp. IP29b_bin.148 TaxID=2969218 RepID=UPI00262E485B|nr:cyclic nucleotide-binding domain-containing protein [Acaryochloris sp. IP29b_bin.148]